MTPVFRTQLASDAHRFSTRPTQGWNPVEGCHGQYFDATGASDVYNNDTFVGVSTEGLANPDDVAKHGEKMSHFTVTTRGVVTVMCDYDDAAQLKLLGHVKVKKGNRMYRGMPMRNPFSLANCDDKADIEKFSIGKLIAKPTEANRANEVRLLLL